MTAAGVGSARRLNPLGWLGAPMFMCALATVVMATPLRIFGLALPQPVFPLVTAFAWALIRPSVLPPFALLAMGLFLDAFWDGPQGLWPLCLLTAYAAVLLGRRLILGQEVIVTWAWYAATIAAAFAVGFVLMTMDASAPPNLIALFLMYYLPTLVLFPFAHRLVQRYEDADVRFR
jgi:rod shape-determining protein MreD